MPRESIVSADREEFEKLVRKIFYDTTGRAPTRTEEAQRLQAFEYQFEKINSRIHTDRKTNKPRKKKSSTRDQNLNKNNIHRESSFSSISRFC